MTGKTNNTTTTTTRKSLPTLQIIFRGLAECESYNFQTVDELRLYTTTIHDGKNTRKSLKYVEQVCQFKQTMSNTNVKDVIFYSEDRIERGRKY